MSSILTNNSAMVALQTLKNVNNSLSKTQDEISTGKTIATAKDNAAIWAISKVMESDVKGFKGISESLSLGQSTVQVGREAAETVTSLLTDMKGKIVAAQEENVDRGKIQTDIAALRDQIGSVVNAAQFNGLNLVKGSEDVNVLASLDRNEAGQVTARDISVSRQDLTTAAGSLGGTGDLSGNISETSFTVSATAVTGTVSLGTDADYSDDDFSIDIDGTVISFAAGELSGDQDAAAVTIADAINNAGIEGVTAAAGGADGDLVISSTRAFDETSVTASSSTTAPDTPSATIGERGETLTFSGSAAIKEGDGYQLSFNGDVFTFVAGKGDTFEDVAKGLQLQINGDNDANVKTQVSQNASNEWQLKIDNGGADFTIAVTANEGGVATGGLAGLDNIDVTTDAGANNALESVETLIQTSIDAAASFGSDQGRLDTQSSFISSLSDALKSGIGAMVDTNMEEASARLQALQVQQQLATQALSIANQSPQSVLSLFR